jgi:outer membrane biosynthesis protein TonB
VSTLSNTASSTGDTPEVLAGVAVSVAAHIVIGVMVFVATWQQAAEADEADANMMAGEVLMLGEVMPLPGELPWIANPEPAPENAPPPEPNQPPPEQTAVPDQEVVRLNPEPPPEQTPERPQENRVEQTQAPQDAPPRPDRGETNPNRPTNADPRIGSTEGFAGGTSLSEDALRNQYSIIQAQIQRAMTRSRAISDSDYARLSARVEIRATSQGRISSFEFLERSGNVLFDSSIETALNSFREGSARLNLAALNPEVRDRFVSNGLRLNIRGN